MNVTIFPKDAISMDLCYICQAGSIEFTTKFAIYSEIILGTLTPAFADQTIMADPSDTSPYNLTSDTWDLFENYYSGYYSDYSYS
jgi:hypothetical protein